MSTDDPKSRPSSTMNPFSPQQKGPTPSQTLNPFAPPSATGNSVPSLNPFGEQKQPSNGSASLSLNPFANVASTNDVGQAPVANSLATDASQPSASLNPFASPNTSTASPLASLSGQRPEASLNPFNSSTISPSQPAPHAAPSASGNSVNPFEQSSQPAPQIASSLAGNSLNPFEQTAQAAQSVQPVPPTTDFGNDPVAAYSQNPSMFDPPPGAQIAQPVQAEVNQQVSNDQDSVSQEEADQIRSLAPLNFAASDMPSNVLDLPPDLTKGLINRSLAISMSAGAGAAARIIGLLIGVMLDQRRAHNYRVDAWNNIDATMAKPLEDVDSINATIQESLKQPVIKWELINKLPRKLSAVPPTLVATRVPLEQKATLELSKLVHEVNLLFADISEHRTLTLASRGELELKGGRKAFEGYRYYAVDAGAFLDKCERRGRLNCSLPKPGQIPTGRVVAIHNNKPDSKGRLEVVVRHESKIIKGDPSYFIPLKKDQVTGFGSTPIQAYQIRLKSIMERLKTVMKTKDGFQDTLKKKLSITKVFAL